MNTKSAEITDAFFAADAAWEDELVRCFGTHGATYARYAQSGHGEEGSDLRVRYDAFCAAREAYEANRHYPIGGAS